MQEYTGLAQGPREFDPEEAKGIVGGVYKGSRETEEVSDNFVEF